ncbi:hypothetical protein GW17_00043835 [Ensete ventricosum]|nr:hypothetical protein GW17_00043835 [Ensete ventricosum]
MVPGHRHGPQAGVTKLNDRADVVLGLTWLGHLDGPNIYLIILSPPVEILHEVSRGGALGRTSSLEGQWRRGHGNFIFCESLSNYRCNLRHLFLGEVTSGRLECPFLFYFSRSRLGFPTQVDDLDYGQYPPSLSYEESELVGKLMGILPNSRAIKDMIEAWLVKAGLNLTPRGIAHSNDYLPFVESPSPTHFVATLVMVMVGLWSLATFNRHLPDPHVEASFADASAFDLLVCGTLEMAKCLKSCSYDLVFIGLRTRGRLFSDMKEDLSPSGVEENR